MKGKVIALALIPVLLASFVGCALYGLANESIGLFSHDIFEGHTVKSLIPFIAVLSGVFVFLPALFYMAGLLFPVNGFAIPDEAINEVSEIITQNPGYTVGEIFHYLDKGCKVRVKSIKKTSSLSQVLNEIEKSNELLFDYL